jgi:hypothetical protein
MENRLGLTTIFISADNESQLQAKIFELSLETAKAANVIAIYPKGSKVYAWLKVESKYVELAASTPTKVKKKTKAS